MIIAALLLAAADPAAATDKSRPAKPAPGNPPSGWILFSDYPQAAEEEQREGKVTFKVTVAQDGFVIGCDVIAKSGSDDLDNMTCALVAARAVFTPALDADGKPVIGTYTNTVTWDLPDPPPVTTAAAKPPKQ